MDSFNIHGIKFEKANNANELFWYKRLQKITIVFRFMELCVLLIVLSRFSIQLPSALQLSGERIRELLVTLISPQFVFIVGNAIIVILFLKSGHVSAKNGDVYDEYMENFQKNQQNSSHKNKSQPNKITYCKYTASSDHKERKIHRSRSEKLERVHSDEPRRELRRSVTGRCLTSVACGKKPVAASLAKDEMSSEEFRRTVEAFIARQQRFLREEVEDELPTFVSHET